MHVGKMRVALMFVQKDSSLGNNNWRDERVEVNYAPYAIPFAVSFFLSIVITPIILNLAKKYGIVDKPEKRKVHKIAIPRLGGLAIVASFLFVSLYFVLFEPGAMDFWKEKVLGIDKHFLGYLWGALVLVAVGAYDDIYNMNPGKKFLWQFVAAIIVVGFGVGIGTLTNPFGGLIHLDSWSIGFGFLGLDRIYPLADLFAVLWIVAVINVVNWLDGLDGLAAGVSGIASLALFFLSLMPIVNQPAVALIAIILAGSLAGFIPYNFFPAKIFMGDSGSMFLGYSLAVFSIISGGKIATAFLVLGFPILDAIWVISRRLISGNPIWKADRKHLHHRLLDLGVSQKKVVLLIYLLAAAFGVVAVLSGSMGKLITVTVLAAIMIILGTILVVIEWKRNKIAG